MTFHFGVSTDEEIRQRRGLDATGLTIHRKGSRGGEGGGVRQGQLGEISGWDEHAVQLMLTAIAGSEFAVDDRIDGGISGFDHRCQLC